MILLYNFSTKTAKSTSQCFCVLEGKAVMFYLDKQFGTSKWTRSLIRQLLSHCVFILIFIYDIIQLGDEYDKIRKRLERFTRR